MENSTTNISEAGSTASQTGFWMKFGNSKNLGLYMLAPAFLFVVLFFLAPVILTGVFGFTNMSTATGITGGSYLASQTSMLSLKDRYGLIDIADQLSEVVYTVDEVGLDAAAQIGASAATLKELEDKFMGDSFDSRRDLERVIKSLNSRPSNTRAIKSIANSFERSILNVRYDSEAEILTAISNFGVSLDEAQQDASGDCTQPPVFQAEYSTLLCQDHRQCRHTVQHV